MTVLAALALLPWTSGLGACSSSQPGPGYALGGDAAYGFDAAILYEDVNTLPADDTGALVIDSAPPAPCPGPPVPDATTAACANTPSQACPACGSWAFLCATWASPIVKDASVSSFCNAMDLDGSALICCTEPTCIVSNVNGACEAGAQTRYECNGGAVPAGQCEWLGASAPNDYCCQ
jgi:hypothetical protein